jgi:hypothetical protein
VGNTIKTPEVSGVQKPSRRRYYYLKPPFGPRKTENQTQVLIISTQFGLRWNNNRLQSDWCKSEHLDSVEERQVNVRIFRWLILDLSIGTACMHRKDYPWKNSLHPNGLIILNIYWLFGSIVIKLTFTQVLLSKSLPKLDVRTYARKRTFSLMITGNRDKYSEFIGRVFEIKFRACDWWTTFLEQNKDSLPFTLIWVAQYVMYLGWTKY